MPLGKMRAKLSASFNSLGTILQCYKGRGVFRGALQWSPDTERCQHLSWFYAFPLQTFLTSKLNSKTVPVLPSLNPFLIFHLLLYPEHLTVFSFHIFPGVLAIFISSSSNKNIYMHTENFFEILLYQPDFIYPFPIDLEPNERPFVSKINRKMVNTV